MRGRLVAALASLLLAGCASVNGTAASGRGGQFYLLPPGPIERLRTTELAALPEGNASVALAGGEM
jgi:hypothetical protein